MKEYEFIKYEGCGNDYIYIDCFSSEPSSREMSEVSIALSDRHFGVGGDGVVFVCRSDSADGKMRMFNSDGSEGRMCGNAVRCVGKYLYERRGIVKPAVTIETLSGIKSLRLKAENGLVTAATVDMGPPIFDPRLIPAVCEGTRAIGIKADLDKPRTVTLVSMGNPHCVIFCDSDIASADIETPGRIIENHPMFPERINVEFVRITGESEMEMRVWERGSGETMACGTGACAAAVAAVENGFFHNGKPITVSLRGGKLIIDYNKTVLMTGPAREVFQGRVKV